MSTTTKRLTEVTIAMGVRSWKAEWKTTRRLPTSPVTTCRSSQNRMDPSGQRASLRRTR
ncbi:MAG: hypothetical protein R3B82_01680 [Sandaracinaceae bacterium]